MNMMVVVLLSSMSPSSQCLPRRKAVDACSRRRRHSTASFTKEGQRSGHLPYTNHLQLLFHILSIVVFSSISFDLERNSLPEMAPSYCPSPHNLPKMLSHLCILSIYNVSPFLFYVSPVFPEIPHQSLIFCPYSPIFPYVPITLFQCSPNTSELFPNISQLYITQCYKHIL